MSVFKKGDKVYHHKYGWGVYLYEVSDVISSVALESNSFERHVYTNLLSFTEYELKGFSQERPIDYNDYIGCWGRFWDEDFKVEGVLSCVSTDALYPYSRKGGAEYENFEPYPDEVLTALGLTNKKD